MPRILNAPPHVYTSIGFDRASPRRKDVAWLEQARLAGGTRILPMQGLQIAIEEGSQGPHLFLRPPGTAGIPLDERAIFLGLHEGAALFSRQMPDGVLGDGRFVELRSVGTLLTAAEASLAAYARALAHWHERHRFCGACGAPTTIIEAGHAQRCQRCHTDVFPRTDPAVIVLVTQGDRCILGRAPRFPAGMYSTLAGFVEPGESLECALAREVHEEVGVELEAMSYRSSQPWPFPQSLMLGFRAVARTQELNIELDELEDARWFKRAELRDPEHRPVQLPAPDSIARFLIEDWLAEED